MSLNLPTAEQFAEINKNLANIAAVLGMKIDISTWGGIQQAVRAGVAPQLLPVGTQLSVSHSVYGSMLYDVVAHDYLMSAENPESHTMTLMCHDALPNMQIDNAEAFYTNDSTAALPAGTYNFTISSTYQNWTEGTYQFTLTNSIPAGGQLVISGLPTSDITALHVNLYANPMDTSVTESVPITLGRGGASLGTFGEELNAIGRCGYGSNNYKESFIRQFLNSSLSAGGIWNPQTKFDRPPSDLNTMVGFMNGFEDDFLKVVGEVIVPCSSNNIFESPDSTVEVGSKYTVKDKFYLPSINEIIDFTSTSVDDDSKLLPYYNNAVPADIIKYRDGVAVGWSLRTPTKEGASIVHRISVTGTMSQSSTRDSYGFAPMCTIV